ncbi:MAG: transcriptional regulator/sugar kinase, partial [Blastococcus sp.]|nr:transcriptional regulator/sugar kinase [Blastococcus sp.]
MPGARDGRYFVAMQLTGEPDVRPAVRTSGTGDIFQLLRDGDARTRAELIAMTGMSRSTIGGRIDQLLESGLVAPAG